jgi:hypothetical protein
MSMIVIPMIQYDRQVTSYYVYCIRIYYDFVHPRWFDMSPTNPLVGTLSSGVDAVGKPSWLRLSWSFCDTQHDSKTEGIYRHGIYTWYITISCCSILSQGTKNTCRSCDVILLMTPCSILPCPSSFLVLHMWAGLPVVVVSWRISTYGISTTGHYCVKSYISSQWVKRKSPSN